MKEARHLRQQENLYGQWQPICVALGHGLFKTNLDETTCAVIDSNNTLFPDDRDTLNHPTDPAIHKNLPLDRLPTTDDALVRSAVSYMTDTSIMADYDGMTWIKMEIPHVEDNDTGDSRLNRGDVNDEDPGSSSDYYVEWFVGPASKKLQYAESIFIEDSSPVMNCQVLKPCWGPARRISSRAGSVSSRDSPVSPESISSDKRN
jgi:hypothetical protein